MLDYMSIPDFQYEKALSNAYRIISDTKLQRFSFLSKFRNMPEIAKRNHFDADGGLFAILSFR